MVAKHAVGGISKTGLAMFPIGSGSTRPFLIWEQISPHVFGSVDKKLRQKSTGAVQCTWDHAPLLWLH